MSDFSGKVYEAVCRIPQGMVATYGMVAFLAGSPRASRAVGNILHVNPDPAHIPCFRVVNSKGQLSGAFAFGGPDAQKQLLEADGIAVQTDSEGNMFVDLDKYLWRVK